MTTSFPYRTEYGIGGPRNERYGNGYSNGGHNQYRQDAREFQNRDPYRDNVTPNQQMMRHSPVTNYEVEHLASFAHGTREGINTPEDALQKLKKISERGGVWAQVMNMKLSADVLTMANRETMEIIEEYPFEQISLCTHVQNSNTFKDLMIFISKSSPEKVGAIHIFQCLRGEAAVVSDDVNHRREVKTHGHQPMTNGHSQPMSSQPHHGVADAVNAYQSNGVSPPQSAAMLHRNESRNTADYPDDKGGSFEEARINRDVEILNHCIEEIEHFVMELKRINEARKLLNSKKYKRRKHEVLQLQAQPPSHAKVADIYQKFKYSFNLLARLRHHIGNPNAPELVHYLFVPLSITARVTGLDKARSIMNPLLTDTAIELLSNCLDSKESEFWQSLGIYWTHAKTSNHFKDKYFPLYTPVFVDGWVPPEIVSNPREEAAAKSAASMVARIKLVRKEGSSTTESASSSSQSSTSPSRERRYVKIPMVRVAAAKFREYGARQHLAAEERKKHQDTHSPQRDMHSKGVGGPSNARQAVVMYDYLAHNNKELTIRAGEKVAVLDDSRRWWLVQNSRNEKGYVPSTVLDYPREDSSDASSVDGSSSPIQHRANGVSSPAMSNQSSEVFGKTSRQVGTSTAYSPQVSQHSAGMQTDFQQRSYIHEEIQTTPVQWNQPAPTPPAPPPPFVPPPPPPPPPPPAVVHAAPAAKVNRPQEVSVESNGDLSLQAELRNRLSSTGYPKPTMSAMQIEGVDVFIPLYKSSTADDVSRWLKKLGFSPTTVAALHGVTAKELFKKRKDDLIDLCGDHDGLRLYEELQVQNGAQTSRKTMTEFQKALLQRMKKREEIQKAHDHAGDITDNQEELRKRYEEQQELIKKQKEELQHLKDNQQRSPTNATFSTFSSPSQSPSQFNFASENAYNGRQ